MGQSSGPHTPGCLTHGSLSGPRPAVSAATHLGSWLCARRMAGHTLTWHTATPDPDGKSPVMSTLPAVKVLKASPAQERALNKHVLCTCPGMWPGPGVQQRRNSPGSSHTSFWPRPRLVSEMWATM